MSRPTAASRPPGYLAAATVLASDDAAPFLPTSQPAPARVSRGGEFVYFGVPTATLTLIADGVPASVSLPDAVHAARRAIGGGDEFAGAIGKNADGSWALKITFYSRRQARAAKAALTRVAPWGSGVKLRLGRARTTAEPTPRVLTRRKMVQLLNANAPLAWSSTVLHLRPRPRHLPPRRGVDAGAPQSAEAIGLFGMGGATFAALPADAFDDYEYDEHGGGGGHGAAGGYDCDFDAGDLLQEDLRPAAAAAPPPRPPTVSFPDAAGAGGGVGRCAPAAAAAAAAAVAADDGGSGGWGPGARLIHAGVPFGPPAARPPTVITGHRAPRLVALPTGGGRRVLGGGRLPPPPPPAASRGGRGGSGAARGGAHAHGHRAAAAPAAPAAAGGGGGAGWVPCLSATVEVSVTNPDGTTVAVVGNGGCDCATAPVSTAGSGAWAAMGGAAAAAAAPAAPAASTVVRSLTRAEAAERLARHVAAGDSRARIESLAAGAATAAAAGGPAPALSSHAHGGAVSVAWAAARLLDDDPAGAAAAGASLFSPGWPAATRAMAPEQLASGAAHHRAVLDAYRDACVRLKLWLPS